MIMQMVKIIFFAFLITIFQINNVAHCSQKNEIFGDGPYGFTLNINKNLSYSKKQYGLIIKIEEIHISLELIPYPGHDDANVQSSHIVDMFSSGYNRDYESRIKELAFKYAAGSGNITNIENRGNEVYLIHLAGENKSAAIIRFLNNIRYYYCVIFYGDETNMQERQRKRFSSELNSLLNSTKIVENRKNRIVDNNVPNKSGSGLNFAEQMIAGTLKKSLGQQYNGGNHSLQWVCSNCGASATSSTKPSNNGCAHPTFKGHAWINVGQTGSLRYVCRRCQAVVHVNSKPDSSTCRGGGQTAYHQWQQQ